MEGEEEMIVYLINCTLHYNYHIDISFDDNHCYMYLPVAHVDLKEKVGGVIYIPETIKDTEGKEIYKVSMDQLVSMSYNG